jgi:uncharacterized protein (DUF2141 family)
MLRSVPRAILVIVLSCGLARANAAELTVRIDNVPHGGGALMIAVVNSEAAFQDKAPAIASLILPATAPAVEFSTTALPAGTYALRVMHDRNGNQTLDSNLVGMPTEPWGFSNNAAGSFGPPGWDDARFELGDDQRQTITLNH